MPKTTPKPPEVIQAQIATFAAERIENDQDREHVFGDLGNLALGKVRDVTRVTAAVEYHKGEDGSNSLRIPEGTERTVATAAVYTDFLRSVGGSRYEAIQGRAQMLKEYGRFEPTIARLRAELADPATLKEHPNLLGSGSNATVFSITEGNMSYAARVPNGRGTSPETIDGHLAGAVLGKGIPHLEQIVAASYEDGVTVAEVMPGKEVGRLTAEEIKGITNEQLGELVDTLVAVSERGIKIDPKPSNIFYDLTEGYGIVDYSSSKDVGKTSADQDLGTIVGWMAMVIDNTGFYGTYTSEKTEAGYADDLELKRANLAAMKRYRSVVEQKLTGEAQDVALEQIDTTLQTVQQAVEDYSNPEWVAERIAQHQAWKRQVEEYATQQTSAADGWAVLNTELSE